MSTYSTEISLICKGTISRSPATAKCGWPSACLLETGELYMKYWVLLAYLSLCYHINLLFIARNAVSGICILPWTSWYSPVTLVLETILYIAPAMLGSIQTRLVVVWRETGESQGLHSDQNWQVLDHSYWESWIFPPVLQSPPKIYYQGWCQGFMGRQLFRIQALRGRIWAVTFQHKYLYGKSFIFELCY